ncbi:MAG: hypothetical protein AAF608_07935 [Pseudomonadota bacterium]
MRRIATLSLFVLLPGCALFAPPYDPALEDAVAKGNEHAGKVTVCAELGLCATPESFADQQDNYTTAIASLKAGKVIAEGWEPPRFNATARRASDLIVEQIDGCQTSVIELLTIHREEGLAPGVGLSQPVDIACDLALSSVQLMK